MSSIIAKKSLSRRSFLRGAGVALSLPFLQAMVPALAAADNPSSKFTRRLGFVFMPMGADITRWNPAEAGKLGELPYILESLAPVKDSLTILSNMELRPAYPGSHATSNSAFLSAAEAKRTESADYRLGTTVDQLAAQHIGMHTQLPSIELAMDMLQVSGQCDNGYACVYQNNLSWSSPTTPLPAEAHPRLVFEQLFGEGGSKEERQAALRKRASLLDFVKEDMKRLHGQLGHEDRTKVSQYLDTIREVERRIHKAEADVAQHELPDLDRPTGVPVSYADHARLMFDLQLLALQGDVTRVISFQLARETSTRSYPETGVPDPHHPLSHHGNNPEKIFKMAKINRFHVSLFAEFMHKLQKTPDGDGSLLDHSLFLYGSGMGNPNIHDHSNLPIMVVGGKKMGVRGGQHIHYDKPTPLANLHLTMLDKVGIRVDRFGDSQRIISELSV
jgi:Protein of unknown function (DUF1552)